MKTWIKISFSLAGLGLLAFALSGRGEAREELCVERPPQFEQTDGERVGYELINFAGRQVWLTPDWSEEEFADFSFPASWAFWRKNDPRVGEADWNAFLRSPGCAEDGQYSYMSAFGRDFVQVVQFKSFKQPQFTGRLIQQVELEKHHVLRFDTGQSVRVLTNPAGERFILVARTLDHTVETPTLPDGWTVTQHLLDDDLHVDLVGRVRVLRMDNKDSYQGPLPEDIDL